MSNYNSILHSKTYPATDTGTQATRLSAQLDAEDNHSGNIIMRDVSPQMVFAFVEAHEGRAEVEYFDGKVHVRAWNAKFDVLDYLEGKRKHGCEYGPVTLEFQGTWVYQRRMRAKMDEILNEYAQRDAQSV